MRYVSLFAGIGGFDLALNRLGHTCVYANDFDKYAAKIYEKQLGPIDTRSISDVPAEDIPEHDLLVGGFPCQAFSIAGKRRGFDDTRGTLFFDIARILEAKHPRYFILENVKGLLSHDSGRTFKTIISTLTELRYDLEWQVLNSRHFGVPQQRERLFIVGHLRGEPRPKVFPYPFSSCACHEGPGVARDKVSPPLRAKIGGLDNQMAYIKVVDVQNRTLRSDVGALQARSRDRDGCGFQILETGVKRQDTAMCLDANYSKGLDKKGQRTGIIDNSRLRRLTPIECERLMGFPDNWTEGLSDTRRYKCLGNAVVVNVVQSVAGILTEHELSTIL